MLRIENLFPRFRIRLKTAGKSFGCKGCVTVCNVGGLKEVQILAATLRIAAKMANRPLIVEETVLERQCDPEYVAILKPVVDNYDAVVSMACGVGPQFLAEAYPGQRFFPAVNTTFFGGAVAHGIWEERCAGCGTCVIHYFDGMCPVARCSKSLLNGPCGGSDHSKSWELNMVVFLCEEYCKGTNLVLLSPDVAKVPSTFRWTKNIP